MVSCHNCGRATKKYDAWTRSDTDVVICRRSSCEEAREKATRQWYNEEDVRV